MKNLNLNAFGVQELNAEEMRELDGGFGILEALIIGVIVGALVALFTE